MQNENLKISSGYVLICLLWGSTWFAIKVGVDAFSPFFAAGSRFILAALFVYILMKINGIKLQTDRLSIKLYVMMGIFSFVFPFGLVYWAEQYIASGLASVLFAIFPLLVFLFSYFILPNESIGVFKIIGVILGFAGLITIFSGSISIDLSNDFWGMLAIVASAAMQAIVAVIMKKHGGNLNPLSMNFIPLLLAGVVLVPYSFLVEDCTKWKFTIPAISSIVYLAFFGSVITFTIYYWLMKKIDVVILSLSSFITPIIALFLGWLFLDEVLSSRHLIGSSLVLIGILFANFRGLKKYYKSKNKLVV